MHARSIRRAAVAGALLVFCCAAGCKRGGGRAKPADESGSDPASSGAAPSASDDAEQQPVERVVKPGELPFEYPVVTTTAKPGGYVLAPSRSWIDEAIARGADKQTFIYYGAWMREPGPVESKIETLTRQKSAIPNALIIPIRAGETGKAGDVVLTTWASGSGMQRAIVVEGGAPDAPNVRYLDMDFDSPSGWGKKEDTLKANTFHKLTKPGEVGTTVACLDGARHSRWVVTHATADTMLVIGFAGRMKAVKKADCKPLPIVPKLAPGDAAMISLVGAFTEGKVTKVDTKIGRAWVKYEFGSQEKEEAVGFTNVAPPL
jgi:hypothetical protein